MDFQKIETKILIEIFFDVDPFVFLSFTEKII